MYCGGILLVRDPKILRSSRNCTDSDLGIWRTREKWKSTKVRWPEQKPGGLLQEFMTGKRPLLFNRCGAKNVGVSRREEKVQVSPRFTTIVAPSVGEAAESVSRKGTGPETNDVGSAPLTDFVSFVEQLPLQVSSGVVLESLGTLYKGPIENKYWSPVCGLQHPFPVGYSATKTYKGVQFKQTIERGHDGPIFVVGEVNKASYSAESPAKAWSLALANSHLDVTTRIHGRKHFGFDCPVVLGFLQQMHKEQVVKKEPAENSIFNVQSEDIRYPVKDDMKQKLRLSDDGHLEINNLMASTTRRDGPSSNMDKQMSSTLLSKPLTWNKAPSLRSYGRSIRLRSVWVEDILHQGVHVLACGNTNHPGTRGFLQEVTANLYNKDTFTPGTPSNKEFAIRRHKISKGNASSLNNGILKQGILDTSLDSILKRMDEVVRNDGHGCIPDKSSWNREDLEKIMKGGTSDGGILKQKSSMSKIFSSPIHRSRIFLEESASKDTKRTGQTRSLANLLEDWNKGGRSQSLLNVKVSAGGESNIQPLLLPQTKVERVPSTWEEKDKLVTETSFQIGLFDSTYEDIERRVKEWDSGKEGRSSILKEIQQLVVNNCADKALQILGKLHSNGVHLNDEIYSLFFPFTFDNWQKQVVQHSQEKSVFVCAPGGSGKFVVAARCLLQALVQGERCLFVTPYELLAMNHVQQLQVHFGRENVGSLVSNADDRQSLFPITVMTLKTLIRELREGRFVEGSRGSNFFEGLGVAVLDRFHTLGDANYGSLWEEAVILLDHKVKLVALSLPTKASHDIVSWISCIHKPCELVRCESEPVRKAHYYCNATSIHRLGNNDARGMLSSSPLLKSKDSLIDECDSVADLQLSIRFLLHSLQTHRFLPLAISFSSIEDCMISMKDANEVMQGDHILTEEVVRIKKHLEHFSNKNGSECYVSKNDRECLLRGYSMYHEGQSPLWTDFVQGLVHDNLVKIVFGTNTMLSRTRISVRSVAFCLTSKTLDSKNNSNFRSDFMQLLGKAGRRGHDSQGNVIFVRSNRTWWSEGTGVDSSDSILSILPQFEPSYSLLLNLINKHTLLEVRQLVESNYGDYLAKKLHNEDLKELEGKIAVVKEQKEELDKNLFEKLNKINSMKLQDARILTQVDVRAATSGTRWTDGILPGLLCAVLPGPSELLYVILCADNNFRLLPACALDHIYTEELRLDSVYESAAGHTLRAPPLPFKEKWKRLPEGHLEYIAEGTAESASVVEVLLQYGVKSCGTEEETPAITAWTRAQKLIEVLERANAVAVILSDTPTVTVKPLGVLISKLHCVENELWYAMALSSSIIKPLTAPELAAICSALLFTNQQINSETSPSEANIANDAPKRLRAALEKLDNLRQKVELLQGSDNPPLRLDGHAVAAVYSLCRETGGQDRVNELKYWMVLLVQETVKLLHDIGDVWGRSTQALYALEGTSGLHNLARRAAHVLQKAIASGR